MAKDVITRFKLENNGFNSKIKEAAKTLSDLGKSATAAGKNFQEVTKGSVEAARAFGSIQTSSNNAKDRLKELTGSFNEVAKAYNSLTREQQKSDWAKAMADSLTQLQQRIKDTKTELQGLGNGGGIFSKMGDKLGGAMSVFAGNLMTKATMEVANLGSEMAEMVKQGVEMAKAGEGIRIAFERLGNGQILDGLREATHGTVTDIELMKAAVKFNDFKLPIEELGTMLAFAQQKAKDTGQSVDYMVDSIVTGLGRKSLMILDNLGLSAAEIKDKMAETGDMTKAVGEIIREQMSKAGDYVETAADRAAQANVDLQNKLEELGRKFLPVQEASNQLWTSMKIGILDIVGGPLARLLNGLTEAGRLRNQMNDMAGGNSSSETEKQLNFLRKTSADKQQARYDKQIGIYNAQESNEWRRANRAKANLDKLKNAKPGTYDPETYASLKDSYQAELTDATRKAQAWQNFRINYQKGAQGILNPPKVEPPKVEPPKTGGNGGGTGGSRSLSTPEQADAKYVQAQKDYEQSLQQAALEVKAGTINSAEAKKKELQAAETLWKSIGDAREVYDSPKLKEAQTKVEERIVALGPEVEKAIEAQKAIEKASRELEMANKKAADARTKLADAEATGELKKILPAQKAVTEADREITRKETVLHELQEKTVKVNVEQGSVNLPKVPTDDQTIKVNVEQGSVNLPKVPTDDETIKVNVEQGNVNLPKVPTDDETIKVNVEQGNVNLPKVPTDDETIKVNAETGDVSLPEIPEEKTIKVDAVPGDVKVPEVKEEVQIPVTLSNLDALKQHLAEEIATTPVGNSLLQNMQEAFSDASAIGTIFSTAVKNGIDTATFDTSGIMQKLLNGEDISDETIQGYVDQLNALLKTKFDETEWPKVAIAFDVQTKEITTVAKQQQQEAQKMAKDWQAAGSAIQQVGAAMNAIQDPAAKVMGTIAQAIGSVALGAGQAIQNASSMGPWAWIAFAAAATATMITTISSIHSATGYAEGGIVDGSKGGFIQGNTYSGDQVGNVRLNAGELVLNRAQVGNLAEQLEDNDNRGGFGGTPYVTGEQIYLGLNNYLKGAGLGSLVTSNG